MSRPVFGFALVGLVAVCAICLVRTAAGIDAYQILDAALCSDLLTDYSGDVCIREGHALKARYKITHIHPDRDYIEYSYPRGPGLIVVRGKGGAARLESSSGALFSVPEMGTGALSVAADLIRANYRVKVLGNEYVAGRLTTHLRVTSRYGSPISREFWIDAEKRLVLCSRESDRMGKVLYQEQFATVDFAPDTNGVCVWGTEPTTTQPAVPLARRVKPEQLSKELGFSVSESKRIPKGYVLMGTYLTECPRGCGAKAALSRYTDGLSSISVFQTRHHGAKCDLDGPSALPIKAGQCLVIRSGRETMAVVQKMGTHVIAVGALPANILSGVADTVPVAKDAAG